jgi:phytoene dehydrogenase-like protein
MSLGDHSTDVAIIGAGPAGLTAAYLLSKSGYKVTVIEKDDHYVGGISRTVEHKASASTSAAIASSPNRRKWSISGTRSCPTISSSARA